MEPVCGGYIVCVCTLLCVSLAGAVTAEWANGSRRCGNGWFESSLVVLESLPSVRWEGTQECRAATGKDTPNTNKNQMEKNYTCL